MLKKEPILALLVSFLCSCSSIDNPFITTENQFPKNSNRISEVPIIPTRAPYTDTTNTNSYYYSVANNVEINILTTPSTSWYQESASKSLIVQKGTRIELSATATLKDGTHSSNVIWSSSDNTIAVVNNGKINTNNIGNVSILATSTLDANCKGIIDLKVVDNVKEYANKSKTVSEIELSNRYLSLRVNDSKDVIGTVKFSDGAKNSQVIDWESSDESVAVVDQNGKITAKKMGSTTIFAKYRFDPSKKSNIDVNISEAISSSSTPSLITPSNLNSNPTPSSIISSTSSTNIIETTSFSGRVYDTSGVPVEGAKVSAKSIDPGVTWVGQDQITANGGYVFRNAPVGARIEITSTKDGWTTRLRTEVLRSNLTGNPDANKYDFGGPTDTANIYSIQGEPEITSLKINGKQATDSDYFSIKNPIPRNPDSLTPNITGVLSNLLKLEIIFSEPVRRDDIENNLRIIPQSSLSNTSIIDKNTLGTNFLWSSDSMSVTFTLDKVLISNKSGNEAKYMIDFLKPFRDMVDNQSRAFKYFRFTSTKFNDFCVFSVLNQN